MATIPDSSTVCLVNIDGGPVPIWEKDAPVVPPFDPDEESDPATWPAWSDNWFWEPGPELDGLDQADIEIAAAALEDLALPPISGGSPAEDPGPTDADRLDFEAWLEQVDQPYPPVAQVEEMRAWYRRHPLAEFNAIRTDGPIAA